MVVTVPGDPSAAANLVEAATAALMAGDILAADAQAQAAVEAAPDAPEAHELVGLIAYGALEDPDRGRTHFEAAYRLRRRAGDLAMAARLATRLGLVEVTVGNNPVARGWLGRARRLIDQIGPCVEEGHYLIAIVGCEVPDVVELERLASRALDLAREYGDMDLEVRALSEYGLALVSQGRVEEGIALLDEAAAAVLGGEVSDLAASGLACCSVVSGCDRLGDVERLLRFTEALDRLAAERFQGFQPPLLLAHCRQTYGGLLSEAGRWQEAETQLQHALEHSACVAHRASALARLAHLRLNQNRIDEAAEMLRGWEDRLEAADVLAELHDARDELDLAASTLRWALRERETDILSSAALWGHLADVEARRGNREDAAAASARLEAIAEVLGSPVVQAMSLLARGRVKEAAGERGDAEFVAALLRLRAVERPLLRAEIHLELAAAKREASPAEAITEARAALAIFERLGARRQLERVSAFMRDLGIRTRPAISAMQPAVKALTRREAEVMELVAEGLSNREIAGRLFLSEKTIEHHVSAVLGKLGLSKRAEVAAWVAKQAPVARRSGQIQRPAS